jgi:hypothetical protein
MRTKPTMYKRMLRSVLAAAFSTVVAVGVLSGLAGAKSDVARDSTWGSTGSASVLGDSTWRIAAADSTWSVPADSTWSVPGDSTWSVPGDSTWGKPADSTWKVPGDSTWGKPADSTWSVPGDSTWGTDDSTWAVES